jgi:hypothetical protein
MISSMLGVALLAADTTSTPTTAAAADPVCYDLAVDGYIRDTANVSGLDELAPELKGQVVLGVGGDMLVEVRKPLAGRPPADRFWIRAVLTHLYVPKARLLLYLQRGGDADTQAYRALSDGGYLALARTPDSYRLVAVRSLSPEAERSPPPTARCPAADA